MPKKKIEEETIELAIDLAVDQERARCVKCVESQSEAITDKVVKSLLLRISNLIRSGTEFPPPPQLPTDDE